MRHIAVVQLALAWGRTLNDAVLASIALDSSDEARLPPLKGAIALTSRGLIRGTGVGLANIDEDDLHSPVHLQVGSRAGWHATIGPGGLHVACLKAANVDLSQRYSSFVQESRIDASEFEQLSCEHKIRIDLRVWGGRVGAASFIPETGLITERIM